MNARSVLEVIGVGDRERRSNHQGHQRLFCAISERGVQLEIVLCHSSLIISLSKLMIDWVDTFRTCFLGARLRLLRDDVHHACFASPNTSCTSSLCVLLFLVCLCPVCSSRLPAFARLILCLVHNHTALFCSSHCLVHK